MEAKHGKQRKPVRESNKIRDICCGRPRRGLRRPGLVGRMEPVVRIERMDELEVER